MYIHTLTYTVIYHDKKDSFSVTMYTFSVYLHIHDKVKSQTTMYDYLCTL